MNRPELEFPLRWEYKIIALQGQDALNAVCEVLRAHGCEEAPQAGNVSRSGAYVTYTVRMTMNSREQLDTLTSALAASEVVRYLL